MTEERPPSRLPTVPTYVWRCPPVGADKQVVDVESSPEGNPTARKAIAKYTPSPRKAKASTKAPPSAVDQAVRNVSLLRPRRDAEGAKTRKRNKRKMRMSMERAKKLAARNAARRKRDTKHGTTKREALGAGCNSEDTILEQLIQQVKQSLRGKRVYSHALVEQIAKIGTAPSAGGSRAAIASILSHVGDQFSAKLLIPIPASGWICH